MLIIFVIICRACKRVIPINKHFYLIFSGSPSWSFNTVQIEKLVLRNESDMICEVESTDDVFNNYEKRMDACLGHSPSETYKDIDFQCTHESACSSDCCLPFCKKCKTKECSCNKAANQNQMNMAAEQHSARKRHLHTIDVITAAELKIVMDKKGIPYTAARYDSESENDDFDEKNLTTELDGKLAKLKLGYKHKKKDVKRHKQGSN